MGMGSSAEAAPPPAAVWWVIDPARLRGIAGGSNGSGACGNGNGLIYFHGGTGAVLRGQAPDDNGAERSGSPVVVRIAPPSLYASISAAEIKLTPPCSDSRPMTQQQQQQQRQQQQQQPSIWNGGKFWKVKDAIQWTDESKAFRTLAAGGLAGSVSKTCVAPLERIKLLLQVDGMYAKPGTPPPGILGVTKRILMEDGPIGFFRGNTANVARIIPTKGILFVCNDYYRTVFGVTTVDPEPLRLVASGSAAGMTSTLCTYPLDLVRSRLMMSGTGPGGVCSPLFTGIGDCFAKTFRSEGVSGFYGGLGPTLCGIIPYAGISFASFDLLKKYMPKDELGHTPTIFKLICGAIAGFISQTVSYPMDTVRRRMQLQGTYRFSNSHSDVGNTRHTKLYSSSIACFSSVFRKEGFAAFYRGLSANLLRAAPNTAIQFTAYEKLCGLLDVRNQKK